MEVHIVAVFLPVSAGWVDVQCFSLSQQVGWMCTDMNLHTFQLLVTCSDSELTNVYRYADQAGSPH